MKNQNIIILLKWNLHIRCNRWCDLVLVLPVFCIDHILCGRISHVTSNLEFPKTNSTKSKTSVWLQIKQTKVTIPPPRRPFCFWEHKRNVFLPFRWEKWQGTPTTCLEIAPFEIWFIEVNRFERKKKKEGLYLL